MKEFQPKSVLLFTLLVFSFLLLIVFSMPKGGISLFGVNWSFLSAEALFHPKKDNKKNIDAIIEKVDTTNLDNPLIKHNGKSSGELGAANGGDLTTNADSELDMNEETSASLDRFFQKLRNVSALKNKISIFHYGDSQIEGDRMTGFFRQRIQTQFGGNGPGMIPALNVYNTQTFKQTFSDNFERLTAFWGRKLNSRKYGAMGSVGVFKIDSSQALTGQETTAWIEIDASKNAYGRAREYNHVRFYYNSCIKPCLLKVFQNGQLIHEDSLITDGNAHSITLDFPGSPGKLRYLLSSTKSPVISGFSLEGDIGVQVTNVAMRGSSGTNFSSMDQTLFRNMHSELNTQLFILQFGGNTIPGLKDSSSVRYYAKSFKRQIQLIQSQVPGAAIIVIGPSDMSQLNEGVFESYNLIPYLTNQMKKVSVESGAAYWDLFKAMGGTNSMPTWVEQGLAGSDYIHFTSKGTSIASQLFYDAFISAYAKWELKNQVE